MGLWRRHAEEVAKKEINRIDLKLAKTRYVNNIVSDNLANFSIQYESRFLQQLINDDKCFLAKQKVSELKDDARKCKILEALEAKNWKEVFTMQDTPQTEDK